MLDFFKLPGFKEAAEKQAVAREWPFLGVPLRIAGVDVLPLTLRRFTVLSQAGSPWIVGGHPSDEAALAFLWVVSTEYVFSTPPPKKFIRRFAAAWNEEESAKLDEYVTLMFLDSGGGGATRDVPKVSAAASYVHILATAYGWTRDQILDLTLPEINQYVRCIHMEKDGKSVYNSLTDRVKGDLLVELNKVPPDERAAWIEKQMEDAA